MGTGALSSEFHESRCLCGVVRVKFELGYAEHSPHAKVSADYLHPDIPFAPALYRILEIREIGAVSELVLREEHFLPRDRVNIETINACRLGGLVVLCRDCREKAMKQSPSNIDGVTTVRVIVVEESGKISVKFAA